MKRNILRVIIVCLIVLGISIFVYSPVIFQEGNPLPQIKGIFQLNFAGKDLVKLSSEENKYLTKSDQGVEIIKTFMKDEGYDFIEQMGSGYFFVKDNLKGVIVTHKQYSRFYSLWNIAEEKFFQAVFSGTFVCLPVKDINLPHNDICLYGLQDEKGDYYHLNNSDDNYNILSTIDLGVKIIVEGVLVLEIDDVYQSLGTITVDSVDLLNEDLDFVDIKAELNDCLPKSDEASREKCKKLLEQIVNFDDCVKAGFFIMESLPLQCATPDGRNFTNEANSDWDMVLEVFNNCEVKSVFQTHSKLVAIELKNGDQIIAYEPQIDEVMRVAENVSGKCGKIMLATE